MATLRRICLIAASLGAAHGMVGCASGSGAAFSAASRPQAGAADTTASAPDGTSLARQPGDGRAIYVSGNVLMPGRRFGAQRGQAEAQAGLGRLAGASVASGGVRLGMKADPLGTVSDATSGITRIAEAAGDPLIGIGKGKPALGQKGAGGVLGGTGKAAGSLIGSGSQDAGSGINLLVGNVAGGRHKKPGG